MIRQIHAILAAAAMAVIVPAGLDAAGPAGTAFTYQGRLMDEGQPASGIYECQFKLFDAMNGGNLIASMPMGGIEPQPDDDGLFTTWLDFGVNAFNGEARWLEIAVRRESDTPIPFTVLSPRQELKPAPYALYALNSGGSEFWSETGNNISNTNSGGVGIGTNAPNPSWRLHVVTSGQSAVRAEATATTGQGAAGWFISSSDTGRGVYGLASSPTGTTYGVQSKVFSPDGWAGYFEGGKNYFEGKVGIGTTNPTAKLHVLDSGNSDALLVRNNGAGIAAQFFKPGGTSGNALYAVTYGSGNAASFESHQVNTEPAVRIFKNQGTALQVTGRVGLGIGAPKQSLHNTGDYYGRGHLWLHSYQGDGTSGTAYVQARDDSGSSTIDLQVRAQSNGNIVDVARFRADGTTQVKVLEITGADLAEKFPTSEALLPGMVAAIDPAHPGKLCLARGAYNRTVAGVVSGAGDLSVGAVLGNLPASQDGPPIALAGRVWVQCDATLGAITAGDLLTTSDNPGHAMRVSDFPRAQGAVIGKAMTGLESGTGLVLVLVNLN